MDYYYDRDHEQERKGGRLSEALQMMKFQVPKQNGRKIRTLKKNPERPRV